MNRQKMMHNKKRITKAYNMKTQHFHATTRTQREAKNRRNELIKRTRARLKEEAWEESCTEPLELIPGGETFSFSGRAGGLGTVIGYEPKRKLFLGVGHEIEDEGDLSGKLTVGYPAVRSEAGRLEFDRARVKEVAKLTGKILHTNEYGCVGTLFHQPMGEPVPLGLPENGEALVKNESLPGGEKEINLFVNRNTGVLHFRLPELVQGMSGSPILQNGKLVGVLTHGNEQGTAFGTQIMEIVGGLLGEYEGG